MSVSSIREAFARLARGAASAQDVIEAAKDGREVAADELAEVRQGLTQNAGRLSRADEAALRTFLALPKLTAPAASAPTRSVLRRVTFEFDAGTLPLTNVQLNGTWNASSGAYSTAWPTTPIAMSKRSDGRWEATVSLLDAGNLQKFEWGVTADGPAGTGQWAVMGEENRAFTLSAGTQRVSYAPTTFHRMGAQRRGNDIEFRLWAPNARAVSAKIMHGDGREERLPMQRDEDGNWSVNGRGKWQALLGKPYVYELVSAEGRVIDRPDPYARAMQGEQRGIGHAFLNKRSGEEVNTFYIHADLIEDLKTRFGGPNRDWDTVPESEKQKARDISRFDLFHFEIGHEDVYHSAYLVLKDGSGRRLTADELRQRFGGFDPRLIDTMRGGRFNDFWEKNLMPDGRIRMVLASGTWSALVNNPEKLYGLRYELEVWDKKPDGTLVLHDDKNGDGVLSAEERAGSPHNDPWSDLITPDSGKDFRASLITDPAFPWNNDAAPRERDHAKWVIYQAHIGSLFGMDFNVQRSTLKEVTDRLDYLKKLGVTTIELLPVNEVEGNRDWGYMGANSLAIESSYGFELNHRWVTGTEALKMLIDEAHRRGLNVVNDVVYNHVGGNYNFLWELDGKQNPYFNWSRDPNSFEKRKTDWGEIPAYHRAQVKQFFVDHAVAQIEEFHFDGLRLDFTEPIKGAGGQDGWHLLREINRQVHFYNPHAFTVAEQFDYDPAISRPARSDGTGAGFDAQWYTEFQHRLVRDSAAFNPGMVQAGGQGWLVNVDKFMALLTQPRGLDEWRKALAVISNHDEVGNAQRTIDVASADNPSRIPPQWARNAARFAAGMGLAGPGMPIFFQGDESMARNAFKWGNPSTWDIGWEWQNVGAGWNWDALTFNDKQRQLYESLWAVDARARTADPRYQALPAADRQVVDDLAVLTAAQREETMLNITRRQTWRFFSEAIALRNASKALRADASVERVYTHNENAVLAFKRRYDNDEVLVVGSLNHNDLTGYSIDLPPGRWQEVFNSDGRAFGGGDLGNGGGSFAGRAALNIPAAGYLIFKRVG